MEQLKKKVVGIAALAFAVAFSAGVANANVEAQAETDWTQFSISEASVRLGAGTEEDPSGLRFKVDCPVDYSANAEVEAYTTISFTSSVLGSEVSYSTNVPATVWRADGSGWNAVLLNIPASDYVTEITAKSYVVVDGQTYESNEVTTSIAKTSSKLLAQGEVNAQLDAYVEGAVDSVTLDQESATFNQRSKPVQLTATVADGYAVTWKSSDASVATVKDGVVTAVGNGTANITASVGSTKASFAVTAENMPISFSEAEPATVISTLGTTKDPASAAAAELSVVDFNGGKALGNGEFESKTDLYPLVSYSVLKSYFDTYSTAVGVTFDIYTVNKPAWIRVYASRGTQAVAGNDNLYANITYKQEQVDGYWKTTALVTKALFTRLTANVDLYCRVRQAGGIGEIYFDNVGAIVNDYAAGGAFDTMALHPVGYFGSSSTQNNMDFASISIDGAEEKTSALKASKNAASSATTYFYVDGAYLEKVFADEKVTHFQFDIIADWAGNPAGSLDSLQIQDNTYTNLQIAAGADATAVEVDGVSGYYKLTVNYSRERFEAAKTTYQAKYAAIGNQICFRYVYGGSIKTAAYLANFQGVTVNNVLSDAYYDRNTVSANSETGATTMSTSSTFALCFDQGKMVDAFYTKGAASISFTLAADGYDIVGFRTWSGDLVYCRPVIWKGGVGTAASHEALNNADIEIVDGKAIITIAASEFTTYFDANGDYIAGSHAAVTEAVGFGIRLSVQYMDGETLTTIPGNTVYTISNFTLNYAVAE